MLTPSPLPLEQQVRKQLRYNFTVGMFDGAFFGLALGFGSFGMVIPLFVAQMTSSNFLIGLVPAIHNVGWQFPQLLTAGWVARLRRYKPAVLLLTIQERLPFFGFALVAWFVMKQNPQLALGLTFLLLIWQGLGGGFTANAWTSMIAKIIPPESHGTFFGVQAAAANGMMAVSAISAGYILEAWDSPLDFALCFVLVGVFMAVSWFFLSMTREPESPPREAHTAEAHSWRAMKRILAQHHNFRWFVIARMLSQVGIMGTSFYTIYVVRHFQVSESTVGIMTGVNLASFIFANAIMGWLGDRWGHRVVMEIAAFAAAISAVMVWLAPSVGWLYPAFILTAFAVVGTWTVAMAMTVSFGGESERPIYIGLANTLSAPLAIGAPMIGGWLADAFGYQWTFLLTALGGLITAAVLHFKVRSPNE
jgi:MFS family permease